MKTRTPYTLDELTAFESLQGVTFPVASWDKRFARSLNGTSLSDGERPQLWRLFIKYRRQINHPQKQRLLAFAETVAAPDLRKQAILAEQQARIDQLKKATP